MMLREASGLSEEIADCDSLECVMDATRVVEKRLCNATKVCEEIAVDLYTPCNQQVVISNERQARGLSKFFKKMIKETIIRNAL